jgi:hypothetical protein
LLHQYGRCHEEAEIERLKAEQEYSDLIHLCENLLKAYDQHQKPFGRVGAILALAIECIRDQMNPIDFIRNKDS